jgi:hypothetical protein
MQQQVVAGMQSQCDPLSDRKKNSEPVVIGPIERDRHEKEAAAPLIYARNIFEGAVFAILSLQ